ncbi:hypothetical protein BpHYR1_052853 [Brachionus plicatilis]|uniref:Uncharacterized protein n=1 Tax=Brachionus plicatilis TaxID=10195 RepID=A0A3M7RIN1_BRAPC|nr:hypothetical protein BpHYR1_052853 [Brachionus plicatilis]
MGNKKINKTTIARTHSIGSLKITIRLTIIKKKEKNSRPELINLYEHTNMCSIEHIKSIVPCTISNQDNSNTQLHCLIAI